MFQKSKEYLARTAFQIEMLFLFMIRPLVHRTKNRVYDISNRKWSAAQYAFRFYDDTDEVAAKKLIEQTIHLKK